MQSIKEGLLILNVGSSGIKFACYSHAGILTRILHGELKQTADNTAIITCRHAAGEQKTNRLTMPDTSSTGSVLLDWLQQQVTAGEIKMIAHRVVYGMQRTAPEIVTDKLLQDLKAISAYDPGHLPQEIALMELCGRRFSHIPQIACFDSAFHASMPEVAKRLPVPRSYYDKGIRRYGFHGLSYAYIMQELERVAGPQTANGRVVLAHLGSGASLAAVRNGTGIDTSMGFTPASGLPMSTRTGDLDPGFAWYLMQQEQISAADFSDLTNHRSGLLGISETSGDMEMLLQAAVTDIRAAEAIALFCYQAKKWIGAFAAALGGIDTLVFSGGIGQRSAVVRSRICDGLQFLGIELAEDANAGNRLVISNGQGRVTVYVMDTDEELMMAKTAGSILKTLNKE
jgi:acetate kinase